MSRASTVENTPIAMNARFAGACTVCGARIAVGAPIHYQRGLGAWCAAHGADREMPDGVISYIVRESDDVNYRKAPAVGTLTTCEGKAVVVERLHHGPWRMYDSDEMREVRVFCRPATTAEIAAAKRLADAAMARRVIFAVLRSPQAVVRDYYNDEEPKPLPEPLAAELADTATIERAVCHENHVIPVRILQTANRVLIVSQIHDYDGRTIETYVRALPGTGIHDQVLDAIKALAGAPDDRLGPDPADAPKDE